MLLFFYGNLRAVCLLVGSLCTHATKSGTHYVQSGHCHFRHLPAKSERGSFRTLLPCVSSKRTSPGLVFHSAAYCRVYAPVGTRVSGTTQKGVPCRLRLQQQGSDGCQSPVPRGSETCRSHMAATGFRAPWEQQGGGSRNSQLATPNLLKNEISL